MRERAILLINNMLRERVKEQQKLCQRLPEYAMEKTLPDGTITKGGLLEDLEVLLYALHPNPDHPDLKERAKTLIDELEQPNPQTGTTAQVIFTKVNVIDPAECY